MPLSFRELLICVHTLSEFYSILESFVVFFFLVITHWKCKLSLGMWKIKSIAKQLNGNGIIL